jgi:hypothetical protein
LPVVHCPLSTVCCSQSAVQYPVRHCRLLIVHYILYNVGYPLTIVLCPLSICHTWSGVILHVIALSISYVWILLHYRTFSQAFNILVETWNVFNLSELAMVTFPEPKQLRDHLVNMVRQL